MTNFLERACRAVRRFQNFANGLVERFAALVQVCPFCETACRAVRRFAGFKPLDPRKKIHARKSKELRCQAL